MTTATVCRIVGGVLVLLIAIAMGAGGLQLWTRPAAWPSIFASEPTVRRTSLSILLMAALLLISGLAAIAGAPWGGWAVTAVTIAVVLAAFWANYALFGEMRHTHTGTNVVLAAVILTLMWYGYAPPTE